jgi:hypothetical protein
MPLTSEHPNDAVGDEVEEYLQAELDEEDHVLDIHKLSEPL